MRSWFFLPLALMVAAALIAGCGGGGGGGTPPPPNGLPPDESPRTIEGTITYAGGSNASGVTVTLLSGTTQIDQMITGTDGRYSFWAPVGTYKVRAAKTGFATQEQQVTVSDLTKVVTLDLML